MKKVIMLFSALLLTLTVSAQDPKKGPAPSPAAVAEGKIEGKSIVINYAQPAVKGRKIWGDLVPFGKVWRTGANNATTITFINDVKIEGQALKAGKYAIFTIPNADEWTIIFNGKTDQWGAYSYSDKDDVLRVKVKSGKAAAFTERMTFTVDTKMVNLSWENLAVGFKVE
jgi:Protein of unknown function (DUF2911)